MRSSPITLVLSLLLLLQFTNAANYTITFSGRNYSSNVTMASMGLGAGTMLPSSNFIAWLQYLKPTAIRYFVTSINQWEDFIKARTQSAWGSSFFGKTVVSDQTTWNTAVQELRQASSSPGQPNIFEWIQTDETVRWSQFVRTLTREQPEGKAGPIPQSRICSGNPTENLPTLQAAGFTILGIWHVTCKNLPLKTLDRNSPEYWKERWELYRWFYLGGRFFAQNTIKDIELYNEPDRDLCLNDKSWLDEVRVRSLALQQAYQDHSSWESSGTIVPTLICPPMSAPRFQTGTGGSAYGRLAVLDIHTQFPQLATVLTYWNSKVFSYHQYNCESCVFFFFFFFLIPSV
jgi:hypothetical protein